MSDNVHMATASTHSASTDASTAREKAVFADAAVAVKRAHDIVRNAGDRLGQMAYEALIEGEYSKVIELHRSGIAFTLERGDHAGVTDEGSPPDMRTLGSAATIAKAERILGSPIGDLTRWFRLNPDEVGYPALVERELRLQSGDRVERFESGQREHVVAGLADSTRHIVCRVRAALRTPKAFQLEPSDEPLACIAIPTTEDALAALMNGPWVDVTHTVRIHHLPRETRKVVSVGFRHADGRPGSAHLWAPVRRDGHDPLPTGTPESVLPERVSTFTMRHASSYGGASLSIDHTHALFGEDVCGHPNAAWLPQSLPGCPVDSLRLECPDCLRRRVAVAPLHRLEPTAHPIEDEAGYMRAMRYHAALKGEELTVASVAELRASEPPIDESPEKYRVGRPGRRRPLTVADVMNGRRHRRR